MAHYSASASPEEPSSDLNSSQVPFAEQDPEAVAALVKSLNQTSKSKGGVRAKKSIYTVDNSPTKITVDSWRMADWDYKKPNIPTHARGLFTTINSRGQHEIAVRGYDKFFNTGEVSDTRWDNIAKKTLGPYELTLKENGCIIFLAGLEDDTLLVCSKHSTGTGADINMSHAAAGERSLEKQLAALGRTKADFARELRRRNATAVAELCDDSFEEHILEYPPEKAGLYLHGVNLNLPRFATYPSPQVQDFARRWGFKETGVIVMDDIDKVKSFLEDVGRHGEWDGRAVEGFVIRCRMSDEPGKAPYHDWFFKYKFEEPYLMYRQWREATKAMISGRQFKLKKHIRITEEYLIYAKKRFVADPKLREQYNKNHGIIALRDGFLAQKGLGGTDAANLDAQQTTDPECHPEVFGNVILVPIATIGCGKTTIAVALTHLFGWGHVQNDNITGKGRPPRFTKACFDILDEGTPVVVADRNNAGSHERKQIITDVRVQRSDAKLVALNFVHEDMGEVRRVTQERVLARGDNHQTIHIKSDKEKFISVMNSFIDRFEPLDRVKRPDSGFDGVIDLDPLASSRRNLETVVQELHRMYPNVVKEVPTAAQLDAAIDVALEYQPDPKHIMTVQHAPRKPLANQSQKPARPKELEYMAVDVPCDAVVSALERVFGGKGPEQTRFWTELNKMGRIQPKFHVTLMHRAAAPTNKDLWERYLTLHTDASKEGGNGKLGDCDVQLERVVYDNRIMAIVVRLISKSGADKPWDCVNRVAHITVGTRDNSVKPKESNDLLAKWLDSGAGAETGIQQVAFEDQPVLAGEVRGVLSR